MSSVLSQDLDSHLVEICARLDLEPVLIHLKAVKILSRTNCETIKNPHNNPTQDARAEALVDALSRRGDEAAEAFVTALRDTDQKALADLIDPPSEHIEPVAGENAEAEAGEDQVYGEDWKHLNRHQERELPDDLVLVTRSGQKTTASSVRSRMLKELKWTCCGLSGAGCGRRLNWQLLEWCRKCRRYLCHTCLDSDQHTALEPKHKSQHRVQVKNLHGVVDAMLKEESRQALTKIDKFLSAFQLQIRKRLESELAKNDLHILFMDKLKVEKAHLGAYAAPSLDDMTAEEATMAAEQAIAATTENLSLPSPWTEKLKAIEASLLGQYESATSTSEWLRHVSETITPAVSMTKNLRKTSSGCSEGAIDTEAPAAAEPLSGIWAIGGHGHERAVAFLDPDSGRTKIWNDVLRAPRTEGHKCVLWTPSTCLVMGGDHRTYESSGEISSTFTASSEVVSLSFGPSTSAAVPLPLTLSYFAAASTEELVFVCGGRSQELEQLPDLGNKKSDEEPSFYDGKVNERKYCILLERQSSEWRAVAPMRESRRNHAAVALGDCVWALGGVRRSSCEFYNPVVDKWYDFPPLPKDTVGAAAIALDKRIMLTGNLHFNSKQTLLCDPRVARWDHVADTNKGRIAHGLVTWKGRVYALGGRYHEGRRTAEVFDPRMGTWAMIPGELTPELRVDAAFVATE